MQSLAFYNTKGGVGKTTSAVNCAVLCAAERNRTLLWDLDSQGAATFYLNVDMEQEIKAKKLLKAHKELDGLIRSTAYEHLDLLPAGFQIRHLDAMLEDEKKGQKKLGKLLDTLASRYDFLFIDCPPSISFLSEVLFRTVDCLVMPVIPSVLSLNALAQVRDHLAEHSLSSLRILPFFSMFDWRKKMHRDAFDAGTGNDGVFLKTCIANRSIVEQMGLCCFSH